MKTCEQWIEIIKENREDIIAKGKEAYERSFNLNDSSNFNVNVILDEDGEVRVGLGQKHSESTSGYEGKSIVVMSFEPQQYEISLSYEELCETYDIADFKDWLVEQYELNEDDDEDREELEYLVNETNYMEFNPDNCAKILKNKREEYVGYYIEEVSIKLDDCVYNLSNSIN